MFTQKTPKREKQDKRKYVIHYTHNRQRMPSDWSEDYYQVSSFDFGPVNLGIRIERNYKNGYVEPILFEHIIPNENGEAPISTLFGSISSYLDSIDEQLSQCHIHTYERQLPINYKSIRVQQHVQTHIQSRYTNSRLLPIFMEMDATLKGSELGAPKGLPKREYKLWLKQKALDMFIARGDTVSFDKLNNAKKFDELSDVTCQLKAAYKILNIDQEDQYLTSLANSHTLEFISSQ